MTKIDGEPNIMQIAKALKRGRPFVRRALPTPDLFVIPVDLTMRWQNTKMTSMEKRLWVGNADRRVKGTDRECSDHLALHIQIAMKPKAMSQLVHLKVVSFHFDLILNMPKIMCISKRMVRGIKNKRRQSVRKDQHQFCKEQCDHRTSRSCSFEIGNIQKSHLAIVDFTLE